jgi:squalene-associated FAD-dependent desaturase
MPQAQSKRVAIVGGGLAGLAAAVGLAGGGIGGRQTAGKTVEVEIFEARRRLGGRAASFADAASGESVDYCQHISMGCCTNLGDFCQRTGTADLFRRDRVLRLFTRDGRASALRGTPGLPAPLHLAPALLQLHFLSLRERIGIGRAMLRLARAAPADLAARTVADWLSEQGQSPRAIERFWGAVLVSALGESVERASMLHAQKVFVDAYLGNSSGYELHVPLVSLSELYDIRLTEWLARAGIRLLLGTPVEQIDVEQAKVGQNCVEVRGGDTNGVTLTSSAGTHHYDAVIIATPWQRVRHILSPQLVAVLPQVSALDQIDAAPITGVHLWFDRVITELEHAALVDMLSQWLFRRTDLAEGRATNEYYYQVVISASRNLTGRDRADVVAEICDELRSVWPAARDAKLLRWKMVTDPVAVFSVRPGIERVRPPQSTALGQLFLAGDWTDTGWPATMEGAIRSGYLAAEGVLRHFGHEARLLAADLPRSWLARLLLGNPT